MKTLIVDDEISARSRLKRLLAEHPDCQVIGEARDGVEALDQLDALRPELVFLDVAMPGMDGFEVLRSLPKNVPLPLIIFATGFDQHALAAFEANALAYLLKPIEKERLSAALERARLLQSAGKLDQADQIKRALAIEGAPLRQIVCRKKDRALLLPPDQIFWFQVETGLLRAHTASDNYVVNYSMNDLEARLPTEQFFRARREVLVNLAAVKEIRPYFKSSFVLIMGDSAASEIAVSERQAKVLRQKIPGL